MKVIGRGSMSQLPELAWPPGHPVRSESGHTGQSDETIASDHAVVQFRNTGRGKVSISISARILRAMADESRMKRSPRARI